MQKPMTFQERLLQKRVVEAEKLAAETIVENILLRAKIHAMMQGDTWRLRLGRWLIVQDESHRKPVKAPTA